MQQYMVRAVCETGEVIGTTTTSPDIAALLIGLAAKIIPPDTFVAMVTYINPEYAKQAANIVKVCLGQPV